ncbi:MAG TPA: DUF885 domain-containing protein [Lachnospiraceae bacterium]|nr:DUF885 domain-containing protein [Lachnospiraceae bacterium]
MHYTIADPLTYGIKDYEITLPNYSLDDDKSFPIKVENNIATLTSIKRDNLSKQDSFTYDLLLSYLQTELESLTFPYYSEPLSPSDGAQSQIPILLAEYSFHSKKDVEDYLELLTCCKRYFESLSLYEKEKSAAGLFMSDDAADKVIEQCNLIMNKTDLKNGTHFLQTTFSERLHNLLELNVITQKENDNFLKENSNLLLSTLQPAFISLADSIYVLKGSGGDSKGLSNYAKGKAYYSFLLKKSTASNKTPEELMKLLTTQFSKDYKTLTSLSSKLALSDEVSIFKTDPVFSIKEPVSMLEDLQVKMQTDFPTFQTNGIAAVESKSPNYTVKIVDDCLEDYVAPAFYLTPPIDNITNNVIYINYSNRPDLLTLYTTLAHEGYPGHLYQSVYYQLVANKENRNPIHSILYYGGYVEGWAFYVENLSYTYAKDLINNSDYCDVYCLDRNLQLCLYSMLDLSIHYYGMTYEQVKGILTDFGIVNENTIKNIYEYIVEEPTNYLKYYVGYLEVLECKELAKDVWGTEYSDLKFHTFILTIGPADFETIKKGIREALVTNITRAFILPII